MPGDAFEFEWNDAKAVENLTKHGVSFAEAATVFEDPHAFYFDNGSPQARLAVIGFSVRGNLLLVVHAEVSEGRIRIISARRPKRWERDLYG